jgi:DNA-binding transcriptional ArsR family regulator
MKIKDPARAAMDDTAAVEALAALGHGTRLAVFRLLVKAGPDGMPAGRIAAALAIAPSTLSAHLAQLERAGLLRSARAERRILYAVDFAGTRRLLGFLLDDCCDGRPDLCGIGASGCAR